MHFQRPSGRLFGFPHAKSVVVKVLSYWRHRRPPQPSGHRPVKPLNPLNPLHLLNPHARQGVSMQAPKGASPSTAHAVPLPHRWGKQVLGKTAHSPIDGGEASFKENGSLPHRWGEASFKENRSLPHRWGRQVLRKTAHFPIDGEASFKESGSLPHGLHEGNERRQEHYYEDGGENAEDQREDHFYRGLHGLGSGSLAP